MVSSACTQRARSFRGDDVPLRVEEAERRAGLIGVEADVDRHAPYPSTTMHASASAVVTGSRHAKSRHTKAVACPSLAASAPTNGMSAGQRSLRLPGATGTITANGCSALRLPAATRASRGHPAAPSDDDLRRAGMPRRQPREHHRDHARRAPDPLAVPARASARLSRRRPTPRCASVSRLRTDTELADGSAPS